jgi:arginine-tRNA-protein transferase
VPSFDEERLRLYRAWHADRESARAWEPSEMTETAYRDHFLEPHPCAREITFRDGARLVGVGFVDETPRALSAVYFFYDPAYRARSLGTLNVASLVRWGQREAKDYVYLGFHVRGCPSLAYKASFHAQERLVGRPGFRELATWVRVTAPGT